MRPRKLDETLDQCLSMMQAGVSVEDCVARNPEYAEELRAQLRVAQSLLDARPDVQPEPSAQARGRARLVAAVAEARHGTSSAPALGLLAPLGTLFGGVRRVALLPQAIPAVLVLLMLGGTALGFAAATGSPDLTAPFRQLVSRSRQERVELRGAITAVEVTALTIATSSGDVTVQITEKTNFEDKDGTSLTLADFRVGDLVKISAVESDDGTLLAREVEREEEDEEELGEEQAIEQEEEGDGEEMVEEADEDDGGSDGSNSGPGDGDDDDGDKDDDGPGDANDDDDDEDGSGDANDDEDDGGPGDANDDEDDEDDNYEGRSGDDDEEDEDDD